MRCWPRQNKSHGRFGSTTALTAPKRDFRSVPESRHSQSSLACLKRANRPHGIASKQAHGSVLELRRSLERIPQASTCFRDCVAVLCAGVWLAAVPISLLTGIKSDYFAYPAMGAWMLAFLVTWLRLAMFPCPRCGNHFFTSWWQGNLFARKCLHCHLPKWATSG